MLSLIEISKYLMGVCPPNCAMIPSKFPSGFSKSITCHVHMLQKLKAQNIIDQLVSKSVDTVSGITIIS